jgi:hypothetical protein
MALAATCPATQVAARSRVLTESVSVAEDGALDRPRLALADGDLAECPMLTTAITATNAMIKVPETIAGRPRVALRPTPGWRSTHSRTVVAMTVGHDGSGRRARAGGPAS